jgi:hypothetical protein
MKRGFYISILIATVLAVSAACAKQETRVDRFYGTSYELARQSQIHNPDAGVKDGPPVGLTGEIGSRVIKRYEIGFEQAAPKTESYTIDVEGVSVK